MKRLKGNVINRGAWIIAGLLFAVTVAKAQSALEGIRAIEVEQFEKAKTIFTRLVQENPSEASNYFYLGDAYLRSEQADSALIFFNKGMGTNPSSPLNYVGIGKVELYRGKAREAKAYFDRAAGMDPKNIQTFIQVGEAYLLYDSSMNESLAYLKKAQALDPKNPDVYISMGNAYIKKVDGSKAISQFEKALEFNPKSAKAWVGIGRLYTGALNYQESKAAFDKALELDPDYPPAYRYLGELYFTAKQYDKAIETYKKFVDLTDNSVNTQIRYAFFLFLSKDYKTTSQVINELLKKDTSNHLVYRVFAYSSYETGDYKTGYDAITKFLSRVEPGRIIPSDYEYLGKLQLKTGKEMEGIESLNKALLLDTTKSDIYADLGGAYFQVKDFKRSAEAYGMKIGKSKGNAADYFLYGRSLYFSNDLVNADSAFARVTFAKADFAPAHLYRARINAQLDPETSSGLAKPHYEKYIELAASDTKKNKKELVEAYSYLGYYYFLQNDTSTSRTNWMKVKELEPENKQADEVLKQLN